MQQGRLASIGWRLFWGAAVFEVSVVIGSFFRIRWLPETLILAGPLIFLVMIPVGVFLTAWEYSRQEDGISGLTKWDVIKVAIKMIGIYLVIQLALFYIALFFTTM